MKSSGAMKWHNNEDFRSIICINFNLLPGCDDLKSWIERSEIFLVLFFHAASMPQWKCHIFLVHEKDARQPDAVGYEQASDNFENQVHSRSSAGDSYSRIHWTQRFCPEHANQAGVLSKGWVQHNFSGLQKLSSLALLPNRSSKSPNGRQLHRSTYRLSYRQRHFHAWSNSRHWLFTRRANCWNDRELFEGREKVEKNHRTRPRLIK